MIAERKSATAITAGRKQVEVIDVDRLFVPFSNLMSLYVPQSQAFLIDGLSPDGEPLLESIQCDYEVFDDDLLSSGGATRLLEDIMQSGWDDDSGKLPVNAHDLYVRTSDQWGHTTMAEEWLDYCDAVKEHPRRKPHLHRLFDEELNRLKAEVQRGTMLYRSRLGFKSVDGRHEPYTGACIGAPPPNKAKPGRANKQREVVLYVADQEETAVAEVRPARGNLVSVAEIRTVQDLRLIDLHAPMRPSNPFVDEVPAYELEMEHLLTGFAEELATPLRRTDDYREYRPSQTLAHLIRKRGYDGIRYPSAMSPGGSNVVIFDPKMTETGSSRLIEVSDINIVYNAHS
ncbi:RES family NAD+ phosphorylase [Polaromonas sp. P1(28)-13]|nr:RES family NAD+ phosphorylase [Polaromonas sp. P1(28)-13]